MCIINNGSGGNQCCNLCIHKVVVLLRLLLALKLALKYIIMVRSSHWIANLWSYYLVFKPMHLLTCLSDQEMGLVTKKYWDIQIRNDSRGSFLGEHLGLPPLVSPTGSTIFCMLILL